HVDNVRRHGLPDMEREWTLEGQKTESKAEIQVKECINCFAVYHADNKACPECGHVPIAEEKESSYEIDDSAELKEVTEEEKEVIQLNFKKPEDCKSFKELAELGKALGYKPGWSYYQAKLRGFIK